MENLDMENRALSVADIALTDLDGEPRVRDVDLAERLGFDRPRDIRKLIERNRAEIEAFGTCATVALVIKGERGSTPATEYWLCEEQALLVAVLSKAPQAPAVRHMLIRVFTAYRRGKLAPVGGDVGMMLSLQAMIDRRVDEALTLRLSRGAVLRPGKTAGALWREFGFPAIKGVSHWFGNRLEIAGCAIEGRGELGVTVSRLFDPDKARRWLNNGGRFLVEQKISERRGQGKLHLVGSAE